MWIFLENNYKIQTISLVRKCFKHISFITIWVQWSWFLCYKIDYIVLELPDLLATELGSACPRRPEIEFNELGFWACKPSSLNSVYKRRNQVRWTRFQGLQTESKELSLYAQKLSPKDSVSFESTCHSSTHSKNFLTKHKVSKYIVSTLIPSHSRSLS